MADGQLCNTKLCTQSWRLKPEHVRLRMRASGYLDSRDKRYLDVCLALILVGRALLVMAFVAALVWLFDGRPVLLVRRRAGKDGDVFSMPKFRTMRQDPSAGVPVVTRLGCYLRRHRLDELPQLSCVLNGTMLLVGPRPELTEIAMQYGKRETAAALQARVNRSLADWCHS